MGSVCDLTGKKPSFGRNVSHSKRRTNRRFEPNVKRKRLFVPELGVHVRLDVSTRVMRTIDKKGLQAVLKDEGLKLRDVNAQRQGRIGRVDG
jgi:large subunit ribosomal protein L28